MGKDRIQIDIPDEIDIIRAGVIVPTAGKGGSWHQNLLGEKGQQKGVYVIHHRRSIKYVGKTGGQKMSFAIRLRRHFQETAAGKHTYSRLKKLQLPPSIKVTMIDIPQIESYVSHGNLKINLPELISLFEAALIATYKPQFQI